MNPAAKLAEYLLQIKAIKLQPNSPFTWSSGWKSPIYCDNRITLSYPHIRTFIREELATLIQEKYPDANSVVGVATAGIAIGALVAEQMGLPFAYCRPKPKEHGMKNQLEGYVSMDSKVVVVEDLISTGGSSLKVVEYLRSEGYHVEGMAAIFTYGFPHAEMNFEDANCSFVTIGNYEHTIKEAVDKKYIAADQINELNEWRLDPANWRHEG